MKRFTLLAVLLFVTSVCSAQSLPYTVDCTQMSEDSPGCRSYNEMIVKYDDDLLKYLHSGEAYVCFRPNEDTFIVLTMPDKNPSVLYTRYEDGQGALYRVSVGKWNNGKFDSTDPDTTAYVDNSEIRFSFKFDNLGHSKTSYGISIRKSTMRFVEDFSWEEPAVPKSTKHDAIPARADQSKISGHCSHFIGNAPKPNAPCVLRNNVWTCE